MKDKKLGCTYQGNEFGAHYLDSECIDGYLWDMDSGGVDDEGNSYLDSGGDIPCPSCNKKNHIKYHSEEWLDKGFCSLDEGRVNTKSLRQMFGEYDSDFKRRARRHWHRGRRQAISEQKAERSKRISAN
ncbi:hypothetical protein [Vibrio sp. D431a]|uniref:hypothetical protein n=1 Tax=Vibrio sp. D431a TaxID=2837388 RepID=UPI002555E4E8|nr:hypothetical protein [Vibrio sp. D431a]MDK9789968.1 hypothetical protein [Vibrio sp. D431a]